LTPHRLDLASTLLAFLTEMENRGISGSMSEARLNLEESLEQEEARLRERLAKIAQMKQLARELDIPLSAIGVGGEPSPPPPAPFDGTIAGLIRSYRAHEKSPYRDLKQKVRSNYDGMLNRIVADMGAARIADLSADKIDYMHRRWAEGGKISQAHSFVGKLRLVSGFGATVLDDPDCIRFASIMRTMRFKTPEARVEQMTVAHATVIRTKAHEVGWPSIALAQALQFELKLRPVDVIGEWVPISEPGSSEVIWGNEKWLRGLRWSDIDEKLVLRFATIDRLKRKKPVEVDLTNLPMVRQELEWIGIGELPTAGPLIICEANDRPYSAAEFRRKWRIVASKAGVPDNVRNGDSIRAETKGQRGRTIDRIEA
jgi:hypothetical protein